MTENMRPRLSFLSRSTRFSEPSLRTQTTLLPRRVFEADADLLAVYERFNQFKESALEHSTLAGQARLAAEAAQAAYADARRTALGSGGDVESIVNEAPEHLAEVEKHLAIAKAAQQGQAAVARELAAAFTAAAPSLLEPSEDRLNTAGAVMENAIDAFEAACADFELAWRERRILGHSAIYGGPISDYDATPTLPGDVRDAVAVLRSHLSKLDRLKADEQIVTAERGN